MGTAQEQAQDELREAVAGTALLLRQEHHSEDRGQEIRVQVGAQAGDDLAIMSQQVSPVQVCVRHAEHPGTDAGAVL